MSAKKFAISIPEDVMRQVDEAAAKRKMTRSGFIAEVLRRVARARSDAEITKRINHVFADPALATEQKETAEAYLSGGSTAGSEW
jgi:metal-responsive CopG/Arc/MetJ family transcriptional regulator